MRPGTFRTRMPGSDIARKVAICLSLVALLLGQQAFVAHDLHIEADDSHDHEVCAVCVAAANFDGDHDSRVRLPGDPSFLVEHQQLPVDMRLVDSTRPLDLSARSPPLA